MVANENDNQLVEHAEGKKDQAARRVKSHLARQPHTHMVCSGMHVQHLPQHQAMALQTPQIQMDTLGIEPRASRMLSGCDTTTPCTRLQRKHVPNMAPRCAQAQTMERIDKHIIGRGPSLPDPPPDPHAHAPGRKLYTHRKNLRRSCLSVRSLTLPPSGSFALVVEFCHRSPTL